MGDPLDDLNEDELRALKEVAKERASESVSRRDALKTGAAALGLGGLIGGGAGIAATKPASAGTNQTGTWGSPGNPQDWYVEDVYDGDGNMVASAESGALTGTELQYESVNAGDITITDGELSSDPLNPTEWSVRNNTAGEIRLAGTGVDVTADGTKQNIFDYVGNEAVDLIIVGKRDDATSRFIDHVSVFPGGINQYSSQGNPGARTYTQSGTTVEISFTDNSNPYNLTVIARGGGKS